MVQDIRKLTFSTAELCAAFEAYARTTPNFMPKGKINSCVPVETDGVKLTLEMEYGCTPNQVELTYRGTDVLRPLILFCIENNIMLPRDGRKSFLIEDGQLVLKIILDLDLDLIGLTIPMTNDHIRLIKTDTSHA